MGKKPKSNPQLLIIGSIIVVLILVLAFIQLNAFDFSKDIIGQAVDQITGFTYISCEEDDGGLKLFVKGSAQDEYLNRQGTPKSRSLMDECVDNNTVRERYCDGDRLRSKKFSCYGGCGDGACKGDFTYISCTDSDSGKDLFVYGVAEDEYLNRQGTPKSRTLGDECVNSTTVRERYCDGNRLRSKKFNCPRWCFGGECKSEGEFIPQLECSGCPDLDFDNDVDSIDLSLIKSGDISYDQNGDGVIDDIDVSCVDYNEGEDFEEFGNLCYEETLEIKSVKIMSEGEPIDRYKEYLLGTVFDVEVMVYDNTGVMRTFGEAIISVRLDGAANGGSLLCEKDVTNNNFFVCKGNWVPGEKIIRESGKNTYILEIEIRDIFFDKYTFSKDFEMKFEPYPGKLCKEVVEGHNKIDADRANVVFVGFGYDRFEGHTPEELIGDFSKYVVDFEGNNNGLFSVEPFKSNKNKFNFWYVDRVSPIEYCDDGNCIDKDYLEANCLVNNKYIVEMFDMGILFTKVSAGKIRLGLRPNFEFDCSVMKYCSNADVDGNGCIDSNDLVGFYTEYTIDVNEDKRYYSYYDDWRIANMCLYYDKGCKKTDYCKPEQSNPFLTIGDARVFVHEFGHQFGLLDDEYVLSYVPEVFSGSYEVNNCYAVGDSNTKEKCIVNSQWSSFIGDGCGEPGVIDCCTYDEEKISAGGLSCDDCDECIEDSKFDIEINCYEGCSHNEFNIFRPSYNSIMRYPREDPYSFGHYNEHLIQQKLDKFSGN